MAPLGFFSYLLMPWRVLNSRQAVELHQTRTFEAELLRRGNTSKLRCCRRWRGKLPKREKCSCQPDSESWACRKRRWPRGRRTRGCGWSGRARREEPSRRWRRTFPGTPPCSSGRGGRHSRLTKNNTMQVYQRQTEHFLLHWHRLCPWHWWYHLDTLFMGQTPARQERGGFDNSPLSSISIWTHVSTIKSSEVVSHPSTFFNRVCLSTFRIQMGTGAPTMAHALININFRTANLKPLQFNLTFLCCNSTTKVTHGS